MGNNVTVFFTTTLKKLRSSCVLRHTFCGTGWLKYFLKNILRLVFKDIFKPFLCLRPPTIWYLSLYWYLYIQGIKYSIILQLYVSCIIYIVWRNGIQFLSVLVYNYMCYFNEIVLFFCLLCAGHILSSWRNDSPPMSLDPNLFIYLIFICAHIHTWN